MRVRLSSRHWLLVALGVVFVGYCLFQARFLILGPGISIETPVDGTVVSSPLVEISGRARNAAWLSLNGEQIFTNEKGFWEEKLIVSKGTSIITVRVRDRFGREAEEQVRIILN
jgi:hypothetical protein